MTAEDHLDALEVAIHRDADAALGELVLSVSAINREIDGQPESVAGDGDRIRRLVERLHKAAQDVATACRAQGFSITAGFPVGVTVTLDWKVD